MAIPETFVLQGIEIDTKVCAVLTSMTGYYDGTSFRANADYTVVDFPGGKLPGLPILLTNVCYFGSVNYVALP